MLLGHFRLVLPKRLGDYVKQIINIQQIFLSAGFPAATYRIKGKRVGSVGEILDNDYDFSCKIGATYYHMYIILYWLRLNYPQKALPMNASDKWLTINALMEYLQMGSIKLYTMVQQEKALGNKIDNEWRFDREEIDQWKKSGDAANCSEENS